MTVTVLGLGSKKAAAPVKVKCSGRSDCRKQALCWARASSSCLLKHAAGLLRCDDGVAQVPQQK